MDDSTTCGLPCPDLPGEMPVMVLPDCHLFPGCLLPLFIFEERYRLMLAHALRTDRMFCIGNREGKLETSPVSQCSTAGLIRCCVRQDDGTSHLVLLGLRRIRFTGWAQEKPFRIARIEPIPTRAGDPEEVLRLKARAVALFRPGPDAAARELREMLERSDDAEMVCDILSYQITRCPKLQQRLLAEPSLEERYRQLIAALEKAGGGWQVGGG